MAYYVRTVHAGAVATDPRSYVYAIYQCDDCGEKTDIRIPDERTYQYIDRACGSCGSLHPGDRTKALKEALPCVPCSSQ
jgi:DNA-directed RNA polymerase subunit RPC12/RpoP